MAVLFVLLINVTITIFNKPIYLLLENPKKHFAYKYNFAKELAAELKDNNIDKIQSDDEELLLRLRFYGITEGDKYFVTTREQFFYDPKQFIPKQNKS